MKTPDGNEKAMAEIESHSEEWVGSESQEWREFAAKCGTFAAYTSPRMRELLFYGDGCFKNLAT